MIIIITKLILSIPCIISRILRPHSRARTPTHIWDNFSHFSQISLSLFLTWGTFHPWADPRSIKAKDSRQEAYNWKSLGVDRSCFSVWWNIACVLFVSRPTRRSLLLVFEFLFWSSIYIYFQIQILQRCSSVLCISVQSSASILGRYIFQEYRDQCFMQWLSPKREWTVFTGSPTHA